MYSGRCRDSGPPGGRTKFKECRDQADDGRGMLERAYQAALQD